LVVVKNTLSQTEQALPRMAATGRSHRRVGLLALALLAVQALIPIGYMPAAVSSGMIVQLCPDGIPPGLLAAIAGKPAGAHDHHADSATSHDDAGHSEGALDCPFSPLGSSTAVVALFPVSIATPLHADSIERTEPTVARKDRRLNNIRARAPPGTIAAI